MTSAMRASADPPESAGVLVSHRISGFSDQWVFEEGTVPEAPWHDRALEVLKAVLEHWVARTHRDAVVYRDCAVRVRADKPRVGFSPDIMIVEPPPPARYELGSMRLWDPAHVAPKFVAEVVSPGHPWKDYTAIPDQCAVVGVSELVVFDPALVGPKSIGGPWRLQVWRRSASGEFSRVQSGEGPFRSEFLGAYFFTTDEGRCLRIANDTSGRDLWPTAAEAERARAEAERARAEAERAHAEIERQRLLARIAELESAQKQQR
jgi:Uma2 family endonuclease